MELGEWSSVRYKLIPDCGRYVASFPVRNLLSANSSPYAIFGPTVSSITADPGTDDPNGKVFPSGFELRNCPKNLNVKSWIGTQDPHVRNLKLHH